MCFSSLKSILPVLSEKHVFCAFLPIELAQDCILWSAHETERNVFAPVAIKVSFKPVGVVPWDRKRVVHLARGNHFVDLPSEGAADQARTAAALFILQAHGKDTSEFREVAGGHAAVENVKVHIGKDCLSAGAARMMKKEATAAAEASSEAEKILEREKAAEERMEQQKEWEQGKFWHCESRTFRGGRGWTMRSRGDFCVFPMCVKRAVGKTLVAAYAFSVRWQRLSYFFEQLRLVIFFFWSACSLFGDCNFSELRHLMRVEFFDSLDRLTGAPI